MRTMAQQHKFVPHGRSTISQRRSILHNLFNTLPSICKRLAKTKLAHRDGRRIRLYQTCTKNGFNTQSPHSASFSYQKKNCSLAMKVLLPSLLSTPFPHHWYQQTYRHGQRAAVNLLQSSLAKLLAFYHRISLFYSRGTLAHPNPNYQNDGWCQADFQIIFDFSSPPKIPSLLLWVFDILF